MVLDIQVWGSVKFLDVSSGHGELSLLLATGAEVSSRMLTNSTCTTFQSQKVCLHLRTIYRCIETLSSSKWSRVWSAEGAFVRIFVDVGSVDQSFLHAWFEPTVSALWCVSRFLLEELFTSRCVIGTSWGDVTVATDRWNGPLTDDLSHGASRRGWALMRCPHRASISLIWWDSAWVVLRRDRVGWPRVEALNRVRPGLLGESFEVQIDVRRPVGRLVLMFRV